METHEKFRAEINEKLAEINEKIVDMRKESENKAGIKKDLSSVLKQLESVRNNIVLQYNKIQNMENDNKKYSEIKKNIYTDLNSFDRAFKNAGSIVETEKFKTRKRSVDFNNPYGNK